MVIFGLPPLGYVRGEANAIPSCCRPPSGLVVTSIACDSTSAYSIPMLGRFGGSLTRARGAAGLGLGRLKINSKARDQRNAASSASLESCPSVGNLRNDTWFSVFLHAPAVNSCHRALGAQTRKQNSIVSSRLFSSNLKHIVSRQRLRFRWLGTEDSNDTSTRNPTLVGNREIAGPAAALWAGRKCTDQSCGCVVALDVQRFSDITSASFLPRAST